MNQMIEIVFRFYINNLDKSKNWPEAILLMQAILNLIASLMIGYSPNKLVFDIESKILIDLLN